MITITHYFIGVDTPYPVYGDNMASDISPLKASLTPGGKQQAASGGKGYEYRMKYGRPDLQSEIMTLSPWGMEALVYVCGPQSLIDVCSKYAQASKVDFRSETFEL